MVLFGLGGLIVRGWVYEVDVRDKDCANVLVADETGVAV